MNILVYHSLKYENYPPVKSLVDVLTRNGCNVTLITKYTVKPTCENISKLRVIQLYDNEDDSVIRKAEGYLKKIHDLRELVVHEMKKNDVLWTTTDNALRELGEVVIRYKHVMQLMELVDKIPLLPIGNWPEYNIEKYAKKAYKVVVPEYNRAHIIKAWWNLEQLPIILPNKPSSLPLEKKAPDEVKKILENITHEKRKIILYQGVFLQDRQLDKYAEAIEELSDDFVFYIMGKDNEERRKLCKNYKNIKYIQFINPPYHLLVTKLAYIGLLPYVPKIVGYNSILNAVYCAPNKIFEFSAYGKPMIGSSLPGVEIPFKNYNIGKTIHDNPDKDEIKDLVKNIEEDYLLMSRCCRDFYDSVDLDLIVKGILK